MSDKLKEQISALVDGELPAAEGELLQRQLAADEELRGTWQRYHLIRDAMREDLPDMIKPQPFDVHAADAEVAASVAAMKPHQRFLKPVAGLAIAASVAMLAVVGVMNNAEQPGQGPAQQLAEAPSAPTYTPAVAPVSPFEGLALPANDYKVVPRSGWDTAKPVVVSNLNSYLVDHSGYAGFGSAQGIIPYSRVAGYDTPVMDPELKEAPRQPDEAR